MVNDMKHAAPIQILIRLLLLLVPALPVSHAIATEAQAIGRLFYTPRERADMDQARQLAEKNHADSAASTVNQVGDQVTLDGFVRKNNGKTTVWINQMPQHGRENPQGITIVQSGRHSSIVSMQLPSGKSIDLKPGQTFDASNGKVSDVVDSASSPPAPKAPAK
jgi:hypothetical protein